MSVLFFQGRGPGFLQEIKADGTLKAAIEICLDSVSIDMSVVGEWEHTNKCGPIDVVDASGDNGYSGALNMSFANVEDKLFALGVLGIAVAQAAPGNVANEVGPDEIVIGNAYFLGGKTRHRNITTLVATDLGNSPPSALVADTNYTLDAASGKVVFLTALVGAPNFSYGHTDPKYVPLMNAPVKHYFFSYEYMNRQAANEEGSLELYKIRLGPASSLDFKTDKEQTMSLKGKALADTERAFDSDLGQTGRRVTTHALA